MLLRHKPTPMVALFRPGIRIQQKRLVDAFVRQHIEHIAHVTGIHSHIVQICLADFTQQHGNTVDIRLTADNADLRVLRGLMHHVLTTAKADLQPNRPPAKQTGHIQRRAIRVHIPVDLAGAQRRQILAQIGLLAVTQPLAFEATIEIAPGRAGFVLGGMIISHVRAYAPTFITGQDRSANRHARSPCASRG